MKRVASKIKPKSGFSYFFHLFFTALIPTLMYIFVRVELVPLALLIIVLGKWRVFAVQPRHWWPNIRANGVDIIVGLAALGLMVEISSASGQVVVAGLYALWLLLLKPRSSALFVSLQALIALSVGHTALFLLGDSHPLAILVIAAGGISYLSARHFFTTFDEPHTPLFAHTWAYFSAAITWVLGHWLLFYANMIAQPAIMLTVLGFGIAALYYLEKNDKLSQLLQRQILFIMFAITIVIVVFTDWGDRTI